MALHVPSPVDQSAQSIRSSSCTSTSTPTIASPFHCRRDKQKSLPHHGVIRPCRLTVAYIYIRSAFNSSSFPVVEQATSKASREFFTWASANDSCCDPLLSHRTTAPNTPQPFLQWQAPQRLLSSCPRTAQGPLQCANAVNKSLPENPP